MVVVKDEACEVARLLIANGIGFPAIATVMAYQESAIAAAGPNVTVVAPLKPGVSPAVNTDYFGAVEKDRLVTTDKAVFFKADGDYRSKIGIPPGRTTGIAAGYDPDRGILTVVRTVPPAKAASKPRNRANAGCSWKTTLWPGCGGSMLAPGKRR